MTHFGKKTIAALIAAASLVGISGEAMAAVYTYTQTNGAVLTINTTTQTGTMIGPDINTTFTSPSFATFAGGANPNINYNLTSLTGYRKINGVNYAPNTLHQQMLVISGTSVNLWSYWGTGTQFGDYVTTIGSYTPPSSTSSTSSGTPVPEPEMLGLFAVGVAGLFMARRRRKVAIEA